MGTLSMTASEVHTKYHWPPERSSDLLGDTGLLLRLLNRPARFFNWPHVYDRSQRIARFP
jgi:hypothetical protein